MNIKQLGPWDYEDLRECPFCDSEPTRFTLNLFSDSSKGCPHFVVAFQNGGWAPDLCPPVSCNGFQFDRRVLTEALCQASQVVCKQKPVTRRHPEIRAYYCRDTALALELRNSFRLSPFHSDEKCGNCGNDAAVWDGGRTAICCSICGEKLGHGRPVDVPLV